MKQKEHIAQLQAWIEEICPEAISSMHDLLTDPTTPVPSKVQLISMILDRTMGKPEASLKVTTTAESVEGAEAWLNEMISEIQGKSVPEGRSSDSVPVETGPEETQD